MRMAYVAPMSRPILAIAILALSACQSGGTETAAVPSAAPAAQPPPVAPQEVKLFNGETLDGWGAFLVESDVAMEDVWSVEDGILVCKGEPMGYLHTTTDHMS